MAHHRRIRIARLSALGALPLLTAACGGGGDSEAPPPAGEVEGEAAVVESRSAARVAGILLVGDGATEFLPCDGGPALWLDGPLAPDLLDLHAELAPGVEPIEGVFLDVVADVGPAPATGPGRDHAGSIRVQELRRAAYEGWNCGDVDPELLVQASGTEPFWSLRVGADSAEFATPEGRRVLTFQPLRSDPEGWILQGTDPAGGNVFVTLTRLPCRNAMSGAYAHLTAELRLEGRRLQGCAYLGPGPDPDAV